MSTVVEYRDPVTASAPPRSAVARIVTVIVMIVALIGAGFTREWASDVRGVPIVAASESGSSLSGMNSYALALLLGGLRGPLVMFLWSSSETQKSENNLEDFDSKVEWIRLLQPEFDSVLLFQIWNKAYNISVKMTSLPNKYATILDALDFAKRSDREKPNDINLISAIGGIYFDKFGNSAEKFYYRKRVRAETLPHPTDAAMRSRDPGVRRTELDPILDANFKILPSLIVPRGKTLTDSNDPSVVYDGSELQFLPQFEPYPYGVSPWALAFNYERRSQLLQQLGGQRHAQLSDLVIDSRPALAMRGWADEEREFALRNELEVAGKPPAVNAERTDFETDSLALPLNITPQNKKLIDEAIFEFGRSSDLYTRADKEFAQHILRFKQSEQTYESHRAGAQVMIHLSAGDRDYLKWLTAPAEQKAALVASATNEYNRAIALARVYILKFSVWDPIAEKIYPKGVTRQNVNEQTPDLAQLADRSIVAMRQAMGNDAFQEDSGEFLKYMDRSITHIKQMQNPASLPTSAPANQ
jgi:hypothetical protein